MSSESTSGEHDDSTGIKPLQDFASTKNFLELYSRVVQEMIEKSYPLLKNKKIKIKEYGHWAPWYFYCTGYCLYSSGCYTIAVTKRVRKYNKSTFRGILAHELCHAESYQKYFNDCRFKNSFLQEISGILGNLQYLKPSLSKLLERQMDIESIKKGYGKELLDKVKMRESEFPPYVISTAPKRGYLSSDEIINFMRDLNKTP
jgi:hypothetical protein